MPDETQYVTRDELREELAALEGRVDKKLDTMLGAIMSRMTSEIGALRTDMSARFADVDARFADVDARFAGVDARFADVDSQFAALRADMDAQFAAARADSDRKHAELMRELGRHTTAAQEETRTQLRVVDDQYRDLPARVTRLD